MQLPFEKIKRTLVVKVEAVSDPQYGCDPEKRSVKELLWYGVVNVNKPAGPTSHQVAEFVKKIMKVKRAGHSGTLDPGVTGVLPVAIDGATRVTDALLSAGKEYVGIMRLHAEVDEKKLQQVVGEFIGKIKQLPPVRSAVKRRVRERAVYYFSILEIRGREVLFQVGVEAGTYIRKLVHDMGKKLGGAHMAQLVRTKAGPCMFDTTVTLQDLGDALWYWQNEGKEKFLRECVVPMERAVTHLPRVWMQDSAVDAVCHGAMLNVPGIAKFESPFARGQRVAVMTLKGELVALGQVEMTAKELGSAKKGLAVRIQKVFMQPGTYPKYKREEVSAKGSSSP